MLRAQGHHANQEGFFAIPRDEPGPSPSTSDPGYVRCSSQCDVSFDRSIFHLNILKEGQPHYFHHSNNRPLLFFSELLQELHTHPMRMGRWTISWIWVMWSCTLRASCSSKPNIPKQHLRHYHLHHCLQSVPAGPGWGLTGPLLSSMNWVNCSLQWNTNELNWFYISPKNKTKQKATVLVIRWTLKNTHDRMQSEMQIQSLSFPRV